MEAAYPTGYAVLQFHVFFNGVAQILDGFRIPGSHRVHHTVAHMILQNHLPGVVNGGTHRRQLNQNLRAVASVLHHPLDLFQMADSAGQTVDDGFLIFMDVTVRVGDSMGVQIGVVVFTACLA